MTDCLILYDRRDLETNRFFAEKLAEHGNALGMDTAITTTDELPEHAPDALINRSRDWRISKRFESEGAVSFNSSEVVRICNDKLLTYRMADEIGIPCLPYGTPPEYPPGPPWVVKSRNGHGGSEVFLENDEESVACRCSTMDMPLVQSFGIPGRDMRAYVLDGEVIASVMRSNDRDFRANYKLGGRIELCETPGIILEMVEKVCKRLCPCLVGVDFVFTESGAVLNEIEDAVGTRMLYALTDLDPARLLMETVHSKMSL